jgi:hypothetical protein
MMRIGDWRVWTLVFSTLQPMICYLENQRKLAGYGASQFGVEPHYLPKNLHPRPPPPYVCSYLSITIHIGNRVQGVVEATLSLELQLVLFYYPEWLFH